MTSPSTLKTIIIDDFHPVLMERLDAHKIPYHYLPELSKEEVLTAIRNYDIVVVRTKIEFTKEIIDGLPNLKCIARGGAGMDNIDEAAAADKGVFLMNAPEGNRDAVAEHALGLMLNLSNRIVVADREVKNKIWQREANRGFEIGEKTIGIIGFGNTGQALAKKLSGFGCRIIAYDKYHPSTDKNVMAVDLSDLQKQSDIISLHIPLTSESKGLVNDDFLKHCKNDFMLVNTSRGQVVNQKAVIKAFKENRIGSFGADVLENENFSSYTFQEQSDFDLLANIPMVLLTPHVAGWTKESYFKIATVLAEKLIGFYDQIKKISDES